MGCVLLGKTRYYFDLPAHYLQEVYTLGLAMPSQSGPQDPMISLPGVGQMRSRHPLRLFRALHESSGVVAAPLRSLTELADRVVGEALSLNKL